MLTDLNTSVTEISSEQLDAIFGESPKTEPKPIIPTATDDKGIIIPGSGASGLPMVNLDSLDKPVEEKEEEKKVEDKPAEDKPVEDKPAEVKAEEKEEKKDDKPSDEDVAARKEFFKNNIDYLISKKIFKDFDGRENLEFDDDLYAELLEAQVKAMVDERYESKKRSAGDYGEAIIDYIEKGGDADKIIDLFKERKEVEEFQTKDEDSQKDLITKYYKEVYGWKPERIKRELNNLATEDGALEAEATEIKNKYEQSYQQQLQELQQQQEAVLQEQQKRQKAFEDSLKGAIQEYEVDETIKQRLQNSVFKKRKLDNGAQITDLDMKFAEIQRDPKRFVQLIDFVMDMENYHKRRDTKVENKVVDKTFKFVKGNAAVSKTSGSKHSEAVDDKKPVTTNFAFAFKK